MNSLKAENLAIKFKFIRIFWRFILWLKSKWVVFQFKLWILTLDVNIL